MLRATVVLAVIFAVNGFLPIEKRIRKGLSTETAIGDDTKLDQCQGHKASLISGLLKHIIDTDMTGCSMSVLYQREFQFKESYQIWKLLKELPVPYILFEIRPNENVPINILKPKGKACNGYLIFLREIRDLKKMLGNQNNKKIIAVTTSSRWEIEEYLVSKEAKTLFNLLIVSTRGARDIIIRKGERLSETQYLNLYTHKLIMDPLGNSKSHLITSWRCGQLSRNVSLFPEKLKNGFNGRRFIIVASQKPPFTIKRNVKLLEEDDQTVRWDGLEIRLLKLLSGLLNFTIEIKEAGSITILKGPEEVTIESILRGEAEIGAAGIYLTNDRKEKVDFSSAHTIDCATFTTRSSSALPRYRAILGPFHWKVWLALIFVYLLAILPITFADKHSYLYLVEHPWHFETMFWYVFGTFTNLFTFKDGNSWSNTQKNASRMLIGWYWAFSIIINACYTGSIIAFITLFVYPPVIDTLDQLHELNYRVGSLTTGGWGTWFNNSDNPETKTLLRDIELVPNVTQGLKNATNSFFLPMFRPYAFLAGRHELKYTIRTNFTVQKRKKDILHVSSMCFVPFGVALIFPEGSTYIEKFNQGILRAQQAGFFGKLMKDIFWDFQRGDQGQLMEAGSGAPLKDAVKSERILTLDDTQGMFLLLGAGYLIAIVVHFMESSTKGGRGKIQMQHFLQVKYSVLRCCSIVKDCWLINQSNDEEDESDELSEDSGFPFKTFDSRVINSSFNGVHPMIFRALNKKPEFMNETSSERNVHCDDLLEEDNRCSSANF